MNDQEARQRIKEHYHNETGEELPAHVVENLELLSPHSLTDYTKLQELQKEPYTDDSASPIEVVGAIIIVSMAGLGAMYLAHYVPTWQGKLVAGIFTWVIVVGLLQVVGSVVEEVVGDG